MRRLGHMIDVVNIFGFRSRLNYLKCALEVLRKTSRTDVELVTIFSVENRDMPWYYGAADAMILCSDSEGSPTSVKEALACNLPAGATEVVDVREIMWGIQGTRICA